MPSDSKEVELPVAPNESIVNDVECHKFKEQHHLHEYTIAPVGKTAWSKMSYSGYNNFDTRNFTGEIGGTLNIPNTTVKVKVPPYECPRTNAMQPTQ